MKYDNAEAEKKEELKKSYTIFCPSRIADDQRLSDGTVRTYLIISNFLNEDGHSYCSNEWLAAKRGTDERTIQRHLEELQQYGYIWREVWKTGFKWNRRIWAVEAYARYCLTHSIEDEEFKKCLRGDNFDVFETTNFSPSRRQECRQNKQVLSNKEDIQQQDEDEEVFVCFSKRERQALKKLTPEQREYHHKHCEALKESRTDYEGYRIWAAENFDKIKSSKAQLSEDNIKLGKMIEKFFNSLHRQDFNLTSEYVEFTYVCHSTIVKFNQPEFKEICRRELAFRNLKMPQLQS
jgi:hypothetical protein